MQIGGMEKALLNLLNALVNYFDVTLVLEENKGELLPYLNKKIHVQEYRLSYSKFLLWKKGYNYLKRKIWTLKNKNKYDFACNYATYSIIGSYQALQASRNNMLYVHSDYYNVYNKDKTLIKNFFNSVKMEEFKTVAFVSNEARDNILKIYPHKKNNFVVINNLFDYKTLKKTNKIVKNKKKTFLFLGRFEEESKKIYRLLDALKICLRANCDYELWLVGSGKDKKNYQDYVIENKLEANVKFFDATINISPFLEKCDILVLGSEYEGFPVVYLEALYFNKKILTTVKVSDDYLDISNYALVVAKNAKAIAKGMQSIKKNNCNYAIDFAKYNKSILEKLKTIIYN